MSLFIYGLDGFEYVNTAHIHKLFVDGDTGRMILSVFGRDREIINSYYKFMDIMEIRCGPMDNYINGRIFGRFKNLEIKQQWMEHVVIQSSDYSDYIKCYYYMKFDIDVINWNLYDN